MANYYNTGQFLGEAFADYAYRVVERNSQGKPVEYDGGNWGSKV